MRRERESELQRSVEADLEGVDLANYARGGPGLELVRLVPLDAAALKPALLRLLSRLRNVQSRRADAWFLAVALDAVKKGLEDTGGQRPYVTRLTLWSLLRRSKPKIHPKTRRAIVEAYEASQAGRPEWQLRGRGASELLGDAYVEGEAIVFEKAQGPSLRSPAGRILRIGGYERG